jgi:hypothetical protein
MCNTLMNEHGWYNRNWGTQVKWGGMSELSLSFEVPTRRYNYHGSQFADVIKVLRPFMVTSEVGIEIDILGEKLFLYAFTLPHNEARTPSISSF